MSFISIFEQDIRAFIPEIFLISSISLLLMYGVFSDSESKLDKFEVSRNTLWLSVLTLIITSLFICMVPYDNVVIFNGAVSIDRFTTLIQLIILLSSATCLALSIDFLEKNKVYAFEYGILILLATLGLLLIVSSYDFLALYLAIELQSLCLYVLATFKKDTELSAEAGLKYFVLGAFSSGLILFGFSILYGFTGSTNFEDIAKLLIGVSSSEIPSITYNGIVLGMVFVSVALLFKVAAAPFHMWAPDVYEGSPTTVTAFFAIVPKIAIVGLLIKVYLFTFTELVDQWQYILIASSIMSMVVGSLGAIYQTSLKRLLAYSAIGHMGYILMGIASASTEGVQSLLVYMIIYIITLLGVFSIITSLRRKSTGKYIEKIDDLSGLSRSNPVLSGSLAMLLFSMAGIPPLAGFFSKLYVFFAAVSSSLYTLVLIGVITSVIGTFYYLRIIKLMYFTEVEDVQAIKCFSLDRKNATILVFSLVIVSCFFIYPTPLIETTYNVALSLKL